MKSVRSVLLVLASVCGLSGLSGAQAADVYVGVQAARAGVFVPDGGPGLTLVGLHAMRGAPVTPGSWFLRGALEANLIPFETGAVFLMDATVMRRAEQWHYGLGLGTGLALTGGDSFGTLISPLLLTNAHVVIGTQMGVGQLEAVARLGLTSSVGARLSFPLR